MASGIIKGQTESYSPREAAAVKDKVPGSAVYGEIKKNSKLYNNPSESADFIVTKTKQSAEILRDISCEWYLVKTTEGEKWVLNQSIFIPDDELPARDALSDRELECYVNTQGFESSTSNFVWVDIHRQRIYIFKGKQGSFNLTKTIICATGKNCSPTTRGLFKTSDKGEWFYSSRLKSGAKYWVRFNGSYLFHSVAMDNTQAITDPVLGRKRSSGCVRMSLEDAEWFYKNVESNTAVWVN